MNQSTRQLEIISMATGLDAEPGFIPYTPAENEVWRLICAALEPVWEQHTADVILSARDRLGLPTTEVPQLMDISAALKPLSGFEFRSVGGLAPIEDFFGGLAVKKFLSTQFIRSPETPFYTEQPDVVHELLGHATLLADPDFAELHRLAGHALTSVETAEAKQFVANVWWFSGEFGLVRQAATIRAVGAGLLSSVSELQGIGDTTLVPLDPMVMGQTEHRTDQLQSTLFVADSVAHFVNVVGGFFERVNDGLVADGLKRGQHA